jgi:hypothetical protein
MHSLEKDSTKHSGSLALSRHGTRTAYSYPDVNELLIFRRGEGMSRALFEKQSLKCGDDEAEDVSALTEQLVTLNLNN